MGRGNNCIKIYLVQKMSVYSPVNGFLDRIDSTTNEEWYVLYLYITRISDHRVHIPMDGILSKPKIINGHIEDPIFKQNPDTIHTAEMTWRIRPLQFKTPAASMWFTLQIGKPKFITDTIRMDISIDEVNYYKNAHTVQLGEILLGSRAMVFLPKKYYTLNPKIKMFEDFSIEEIETLREEEGRDALIAGETILATLQERH